MNIYKELLTDHYKHPRNKGKLRNSNYSSKHYNPSCGDAISFEILVQDGIVADVAFDGYGCVISQATASILGEYIKGKTMHDVAAITAEQIQELIGLQLGPLRLRCALLPLQALHALVQDYFKQQGNK